MRTNWIGLSLAVAVCATWAAFASAATTVNNYNWMQIPVGLSTAVITGVGSPTTSAFNSNPSGFDGHNTPGHMRWSNLWIPSASLNNNSLTTPVTEGKGDYWTTVQLDQTRHVERFDFKLWVSEGTAVRRARIEGSTNGVTFSQIGIHDFGSMTTGDQTILNVPITAGNYTHVRLRFNGTDTMGGGNADYRYGNNTGRAGPGVYHMEVLGDDTLASDKVNWANKPNFSTTNVNSTVPNVLVFNGLDYTDGFIRDAGGGRTGDDNVWNPGKFAQIDLGQQRLIGKSMFQWNDQNWGGTTVSLEWSNDNVTYTPVTSPSHLNIVGSGGAHRVNFDPVIARYFRVTHIGPDNTNAFYIFDEWMTFSPLAGVLQATPTAGSTIMMSGDTGSTLTTPITLQNVGSAGSQIGIIGYTITGPDAALFDLSNFSQEILSQNESIIYDLEFLATLDGTYTALLTFNTSLGDVTFDLVATVAEIPEPSTLVLLGLGAVGCVVTARRRRQRQSN